MLPPFAATPPGALDLTGDAARRRRQLQRSAAAALERAGYQELIPPSFEYEDVFLRALGRYSDAALARLLVLTAQADRIVKGAERGPVWETVISLILELIPPARGRQAA